jgi:hypothetical protein
MCTATGGGAPNGSACGKDTDCAGGACVESANGVRVCREFTPDLQPCGLHHCESFDLCNIDDGPEPFCQSF